MVPGSIACCLNRSTTDLNTSRGPPPLPPFLTSTHNQASLALRSTFPSGLIICHHLLMSFGSCRKETMAPRHGRESFLTQYAKHFNYSTIEMRSVNFLSRSNNST